MRVLRYFLLILPLLALAVIGVAGGADFKTDRLTIHSGQRAHHFTVELAITPEQQAQGLMHRKSLPPDRGMLFPLETPRAFPMWMKNTLIPLDMLFIGPDWRIAHIHANAEPESEAIIESGGKMIAVLELAGGTAESKHIEVGDKVEYAGARR